MQKNFVNEEKEFEDAMPNVEVPPELSLKPKNNLRLSKRNKKKRGITIWKSTKKKS